jgi:hypothetical protein
MSYPKNTVKAARKKVRSSTPKTSATTKRSCVFFSVEHAIFRVILSPFGNSTKKKCNDCKMSLHSPFVSAETPATAHVAAPQLNKVQESCKMSLQSPFESAEWLATAHVADGAARQPGPRRAGVAGGRTRRLLRSLILLLLLLPLLFPSSSPFSSSSSSSSSLLGVFSSFSLLSFSLFSLFDRCVVDFG